MKVRLKLNKSCDSKLKFVKILKDYTGCGLKDSKDICDYLHETPYKPVEFLLDVKDLSDVDSFRNSLLEMGLDFELTGGTVHERNKKLLLLGIGEKEDYVQFLEEALIDQREVISLLLNKLSKDDLKDIFNNIKMI